jgi:hypothetical protein
MSLIAMRFEPRPEGLQSPACSSVLWPCHLSKWHCPQVLVSLGSRASELVAEAKDILSVQLPSLASVSCVSDAEAHDSSGAFHLPVRP